MDRLNVTLYTTSIGPIAGLSGTLFPISLHMRAAYYLRITVTNATIGTATFW